MTKVLISAVVLLLCEPAGPSRAMIYGSTGHAGARLVSRKAIASREPREAGQSAYAAIGEVVRILLADPQTDWAGVDVDALRAHLVDMDEVTLRADVVKTKLSNGAFFQVTGKGAVVGSIQRLTTAHFAQPQSGKRWTMSVNPTASGADVTVVSTDPAEAAEIYGLGFFGILTTGMHHQPHHLMMARGMMQHSLPSRSAKVR